MSDPERLHKEVLLIFTIVIVTFNPIFERIFFQIWYESQMNELKCEDLNKLIKNSKMVSQDIGDA